MNVFNFWQVISGFDIPSNLHQRTADSKEKTHVN